MKRKKVTIAIDQGDRLFDESKPIIAEARCETCCCFADGVCMFFPKYEEKWTHNWCQQYIPDADMFD